MDKICSWHNCSRPVKYRNLCGMHIARQKRGADMDAPPREWSPWPRRLWEKVDRKGEDDCWEWLAFRNEEGYGVIAMNGYPRRAHRMSYELLIGPIPEGLHLDHLCRNRGCVNPKHLEPVTNAENIRRAQPFRVPMEPRVQCPNGHEYTPENTRRAKDGTRRCRTCERRDALAGYYRNRAVSTLDRSECAHCGRDVAIHPDSRQFAHHTINQSTCLFECCQLAETCAGTLKDAAAASRRVDDRSSLRNWGGKAP